MEYGDFNQYLNDRVVQYLINFVCSKVLRSQLAVTANDVIT